MTVRRINVSGYVKKDGPAVTSHGRIVEHNPSPTNILQGAISGVSDLAGDPYRVVAGYKIPLIDMPGGDSLVRIENMSLVGENLSGLDFGATIFRGVDLTGADFSGSNLNNAIFDDVILDNVKLHGVQTKSVTMTDVRGEDIVGDELDINEAFLSNVRLGFSKRDKQVAVLGLANATLDGSIRLSNADFSSANQFSHFTLKNATLKDCSFAGMDLNAVDFRDCKLDGGDFTGANLRYSFFIDTRARGCKFDGAFLDDGSFCEGSLRDSSFRNAKLQRFGFYWSDLKNTDWKDAVMLPEPTEHGACMFAGCDLSGSDFSGADLGETNFAYTSKVVRPATAEDFVPSDITNVKWLGAHTSGIILSVRNPNHTESEVYYTSK